MTDRLRDGILDQLSGLAEVKPDIAKDVALGDYTDWDSLEEEDIGVYSTVLGAACYFAGVCDALGCHIKQLYKLYAIDLDEVLKVDTP